VDSVDGAEGILYQVSLAATLAASESGSLGPRCAFGRAARAALTPLPARSARRRCRRTCSARCTRRRRPTRRSPTCTPSPRRTVRCLPCPAPSAARLHGGQPPLRRNAAQGSCSAFRRGARPAAHPAPCPALPAHARTSCDAAALAGTGRLRRSSGCGARPWPGSRQGRAALQEPRLPCPAGGRFQVVGCGADGPFHGNFVPKMTGPAARAGAGRQCRGWGGTRRARAQAMCDRTGGLWMTGALRNKPAGLFTSTASQGGGQEVTCLTSAALSGLTQGHLPASRGPAPPLAGPPACEVRRPSLPLFSAGLW